MTDNPSGYPGSEGVGKAGASWALVVSIFAVFLIAGIWTLALSQIASERTEFRRNVTDHLGNIAVTMSHNISRTSGELDTLLKFMRAMRRSQGPDVSWQEIVSEDYTLNRHTVQIAVIAADGMMVTSTKMLYPERPVDLSDREHYTVHRDAGVDSLFISKPVLGRASGKWSVQYTRPLLDAENDFDGVIVVSLDPARLTRIYGNLDLGENGGVVIVGTDGIIRAGTGHYAMRLGQMFEEGESYREFDAGSSVLSAGIERRGGADRIVVSQQVDGYPLRVVLLADDIGGLSWLLQVQAYVFGAVLLTLLTIYAAYSAIQHRLREISLLREQSRVRVEKEVAEAASKTKGEFLAVMSHEIRTPLNGVLGAIELMKVEDLTPSARRHLEIAETSGEYLLSLIDDILVFSKLEEGHFRLDESPQSLADIVDGLESVFRPLVEKVGNRLNVVCDRDEMPSRIVCDGVRLRQVLVNLLTNANKFTSRGDITLRCAVRPREGSRVEVRFSVEDTGIGIPEDKQKLIFDKFQSLDASYSRRSDGTGLGLAICEKIANAMGSRIELESRYGVGSSFSFVADFAIEPENAVASNANEGLRTGGHRPLRVLLAEDNGTNAYIASQYLSAVGHRVVHVEHGQAAVARASAQAFDIILMDISMPQMDGMSAAALIRSGPSLNETTPIIALTAHAVPGTAEKIRANGMDAYLTKPIGRERLLATVRKFGGTGGLVSPEIGNDEPILESAGFEEFLHDREIDADSPLFLIFVSEMEARHAALQAAITASDTAKVGAIAHSIYGSASTVSASRLAAQCRYLEQQAKYSALDWSIATATLTTLEETIREFRIMIDKGRQGEARQVKVA